jgi:hypothetical protein
MYHAHGDLIGPGMFDKLPPGAVGNLAGTEDQHIGPADLFFDASFLPIEYLQGNP